jgi:predicted nucleic acid-binding protein
MKVVFDTNVLVDATAVRKPFFFVAEQLILLASEEKIDGFMTSNSLTDLYYILRKSFSVDKAKDTIRQLLKFLAIIEVNGDDCVSALGHGIVDLEDALLVLCAEKINADYIISRDDNLLCQNSAVKIMTPDDFMNSFEKTTIK